MAATVTIIKPNTALAKLTTDSIASDNKPTESVRTHAKVLSAMVMHATTTDAHNKPLGENHLDSVFMYLICLQRDAREFAFAYLHNERPNIELQTLVTDHARVNAHATAFNQTVGFAA